MADDTREQDVGTLFIWLDGDPLASEPDATIPDTPGVNDLDQLADAVRAGRLGRYLPVTLSFSPHARPTSQRSVRSVDVAKLLRDRHIRHRRRYEVIGNDPTHGEDEPEG